MLLDGYWKKDLKRVGKSLSFWSKHRSQVLRNYSEHKVNSGLLFSAAIIRKIVEDEKDAERVIRDSGLFMPSLPIIKISVPVKKYPHVNEDKFFSNSCVFLKDYDLDNGMEESVPLAWVCNQIIHSYAWGIVYQKVKGVHGVLLASDRFKEEGICYLNISDWVTTIKYIIENASI